MTGLLFKLGDPHKFMPPVIHIAGTNGKGSTSAFLKSIFESAEANFAWNEWGIFNGTVATSRILNRKVDYVGTKQAGETWTFTINITLS